MTGRRDRAGCPSWCVSTHAAGELEPTHVGQRRTEVLRARAAAPARPGTARVIDLEYAVALVRYGAGPETWVRLEPAGRDPVEIDLEDMSQWVMLIGRTMVDGQDPPR